MNSILDRLRSWRYWVKQYFAPVFALFRGALVFNRTRVTPQEGYFGLVELFCRTGGASNDAIHSLVQLCDKPYGLPSEEGILGKMSSGELNRVTGILRDQGYYVFPKKVSNSFCNQLSEIARQVPCRPRLEDEGRSGPAQIIDLKKPIAPTYHFEEKTLIQQPAIQELITDFSLISVAQNYLGCAPILDIVAMWWSLPYMKDPSTHSGQLYHFDMDRIKWLKFFLYLSEVTPETGPHCFIAKSHRTGGKPKSLLQAGYARLPEEKVAAHYPREDMIELVGPPGTIVAVDTRGFHKGKPVLQGHRLLAQIEFCDSLFGAEYYHTPISVDRSSNFYRMAQDYPRIYSKFDLQVQEAA